MGQADDNGSGANELDLHLVDLALFFLVFFNCNKRH